MWFMLALLSALFQVLRNMAMKRLGHILDETINVWGRFVFLLPFAALGVAALRVPALADLVGIAPRPFAALGLEFWAMALVFGFTQNLAALSLSKALHASEISLVTALWKVSLLFLVVWGFLALGETPSALGLAGVLISMTGVYLLNVHKARVSIWAPLASLATDRGQRWTLLAGIGYAASVVVIKRLAQLSDPMMAVLMGYVFCAVLITPYTLHRSRAHFQQVGRFWKSFVSMGLSGTLSTWFGTTAYTLTLSSYVEAVKQVEILLALAIGYLMFNEAARIRLIWPGTIAMLLGMVLLKLGE